MAQQPILSLQHYTSQQYSPVIIEDIIHYAFCIGIVLSGRSTGLYFQVGIQVTKLGPRSESDAGKKAINQSTLKQYTTAKTSTSSRARSAVVETIDISVSSRLPLRSVSMLVRY